MKYIIYLFIYLLFIAGSVSAQTMTNDIPKVEKTVQYAAFDLGFWSNFGSGNRAPAGSTYLVLLPSSTDHLLLPSSTNKLKLPGH